MGTLNMGTPFSNFTKPPLPTMPIIVDTAQRSCLYEPNSAGTMGADASPGYFVPLHSMSRFCQGFWKFSDSCRPSYPHASPAGFE